MAFLCYDMDIGKGVTLQPPHTAPRQPMTYEDSFLATCDAEGYAPAWAIRQIFAEHGSDLLEYQAGSGDDWDRGQTILTWLGY